MVDPVGDRVRRHDTSAAAGDNERDAGAVAAGRGAVGNGCGGVDRYLIFAGGTNSAARMAAPGFGAVLEATAVPAPVGVS